MGMIGFQLASVFWRSAGDNCFAGVCPPVSIHDLIPCCIKRSLSQPAWILARTRSRICSYCSRGGSTSIMAGIDHGAMLNVFFDVAITPARWCVDEFACRILCPPPRPVGKMSTAAWRFVSAGETPRPERSVCAPRAVRVFGESSRLVRCPAMRPGLDRKPAERAPLLVKPG